jgi:GntR family transcriptional regulator / MocR family aminotransferase
MERRRITTGSALEPAMPSHVSRIHHHAISHEGVVGGNNHLRGFRYGHYDHGMNDVSGGILPVIAVDRRAASPLHKQIYEGFRSAIVRRDLHPGQRIPSSRELAAQLGVSRIPVLNAYAQLLAEGYFESRVGAGTFVSRSLENPLAAFDAPTATFTDAMSGPRPVSRRSMLLPLYEKAPWARGWGAFGVHQPALDQFPFQVWSSLVAAYARSARATAIQQTDPLGLEAFREAICAYLSTARAVRCGPHQVMVVSGSQQALDIAARVVLDPGNSVWVEEPGYWLARNLFVGAGCRLVPVPVDDEGINVAAGIKRCRRARAAYVTPSHQYPLGTTMSASRRLQLLNWAQSSGSWIIEDDYDSEYRFETMPVPSLQGLDHNSRVIYIGTFSKVLFPSLRLGYIVIPSDLLDRFIAVRHALDIFPPYLYQEVLTDFMRAGHFARHIRRMRLLYSERRTALVAGLRKEFGEAVTIHGAEAGMHLTMTLPEQFRDREIAERAARERLWLWPLSRAYLGGPARQGFILGFGSTPAAQMSRAVSRLRAMITASSESS